MEVQLKKLDNRDLLVGWKNAFEKNNKHRTDEYYERCLEENESGICVTLIALVNHTVAGICHLKYESDYPYFYNHQIPEVNALDVFPEFRKHGIATRLVDELESIARIKYKRIGIGVGLFKDYGIAQRMYYKRGYVPDGNGVIYNGREVLPGEMVRVDDDLNLFFIKEFEQENL
ncbi:Ribosomal protein S18 acetylase RimI [Paenibacillus sp. CF095]|uniref:GNAT family N-acetyltransferase n=1 Tax=Paenibacillus sp. CF095 TaxID=1881033 RepID=UPI00088E2884|nr:GNAT family N-acetyltransferase [Paenibacillus sp. CF095]SDC76895.1 Ribosomal protein S18 acetylase RimI [Paenibacillus sp. CF095]